MGNFRPRDRSEETAFFQGRENERTADSRSRQPDWLGEAARHALNGGSREQRHGHDTAHKHLPGFELHDPHHHSRGAHVSSGEHGVSHNHGGTWQQRQREHERETEREREREAARERKHGHHESQGKKHTKAADDEAPAEKGDGPNLSKAEKESYLFNRLTDSRPGGLHLTKEQAAGVIGNLEQESKLNSDYTSHRNKDGRMEHNLGIAQWVGARKHALESFSGHDPTNFYKQVAFMEQELKGPERSALNALRRTNDASSAALSFSQHFERPGDPHNTSRQRYARNFLKSAHKHEMIAQGDS